jgi:hypothetical protein
MDRIIFALAGAFASSAALGDTLQFDGSYAFGAPADGCIVGKGDVQGAAFQIQDGLFIGLESSCRLTNRTAIRDMPSAALFDLECSGEGEVWTERLFLLKQPDGALLWASDRGAAIHQTCTPAQ